MITWHARAPQTAGSPHPALNRQTWVSPERAGALVFAVDSIPAFLAVTTDPFVVYTSNVFGLLGMRALYFLLAGAAARFRFLRPRLAGHSGRHGRQAAPCGRLQVPYLGLASLRPRRRRHSVLSIRDTK